MTIRSRAALTGVATLACGLAALPAVARATVIASAVPEAVARHQAALIAHLPPTTTLHLSIALPMRDPAGLRGLLGALYDPRSPQYRQFLSVADFTDRFGPSPETFDAAAAFFARAGFTVDATAANRFLLLVDGTAAQVEQVFHVTLNLYRHPTEARAFLAPDREPTPALATPVLEITGLDDFRLPRPRVYQASPSGRATGSGPGGEFDGSDMRPAYYPTGTLTGAGQSLGLMELGGYNIADVNNFFSRGYGPANSVPVRGISTDGASLSCTGRCDDSEQVLDIEYAISVAPGLSQVQVYVGRNAEDVLNREASDNTSAQLSTSWGWGEKFATDDALFQEMAAQGQSFLTASGDYSSLKASGPWPEEDANLTGVGGTDLTTAGGGGAWRGETGWSGSAGGPSLDTSITIPSWQKPFVTAANKASSTLRNVPDIAAIANDFYICADGKCSGGWAGTSFASPIWTGFVALANQQAASHGEPRLGFLNPALYAIAGGTHAATDYHDETTGKSGKFTCTPSFDLVTGVGSPAGQSLINALAP